MNIVSPQENEISDQSMLMVVSATLTHKGIKKRSKLKLSSFDCLWKLNYHKSLHNFKKVFLVPTPYLYFNEVEWDPY